MQTRLVECIPNFSEGRRPETVRLIAEAIAATKPACVLDTHVDPDHNRSVITFVAPPETIVAAAVNAVRRASELIDMRSHSGEHPRLGATDVLPFVPLNDVSMDDCVTLAHEAKLQVALDLIFAGDFSPRLEIKSPDASARTVHAGNHPDPRRPRQSEMGRVRPRERAAARSGEIRPFPRLPERNRGWGRDPSVRSSQTRHG